MRNKTNTKSVQLVQLVFIKSVSKTEKKTKKTIMPCTHYFSCTLGKLQVVAQNSGWFIVLFAPVVIVWLV